LNAWYHLAMARVSNTVTLYSNGTSVLSGTTNYTTSENNVFRMFNDPYLTPNTSAQGYLNSVRVITGQALYTGNFTAPVGPLTATTVGTSGANVAASITGTVAILTGQTPDLRDVGPSALPLSTIGSPTTIQSNPYGSGPDITVYGYKVGVNCNAPAYTLDVNGAANIQSNLTAPAIGTSSLTVSSITLATGNTSITGQYNYTQSLGTLTSGGLIAINAPNRSGLYAMVIRTTATDASSMQACLSAMGYYNTVSGWTYGGNGYSVLNGVTNGSQFAQFYVNLGTLYYKVQGATATSMSCAVIQIGGVISGF